VSLHHEPHTRNVEFDRGARAADQRPFTALPRHIADDPAIHPTDKAILLVLAGFCWGKKTLCWPSNATIARRVGRTPEHVQRRLVALEAAGLILRAPCAANRTGRTIRLLWRCPSPAPALPPTPAPALPKEDVVVRQTKESENTPTEIPERSRPDPIAEPVPEPTPEPAPEPAQEPAPEPLLAAPEMVPAVPLTPEEQARLAALPATARDQVLGWLATGDRILLAEARKLLAPPLARPKPPATLPELLGRVREDPGFPAAAASLLARELNDHKSYAGFLARCTEAWRGELEPGRLVAALEQATGGKARKPGALFMHTCRTTGTTITNRL
jgi:hypothetical protein